MKIIKIMREVRIIGQTIKRMIQMNTINNSPLRARNNMEIEMIVKRIIEKLMKENKITNKIPEEVIILTITINQNNI